MANARPTVAAACLFLMLAAGCAATRAVRTLGKPGATELSFGAGGPVSSDYGSANPPPVPVLSVGARRALTERADVFADAQVGGVIFGLAWLDAGGALSLLERDRGPSLLVSGTTHVLTNLRDTMVLQQVGCVLSLQLSTITPYVGWDSVFELGPAFDHLPIPFLGARFDRGRWFVQPEVRWYAPFSDGRRSTSHYLSPGGAGALGISTSWGVRL